MLRKARLVAAIVFVFGALGAAATGCTVTADTGSCVIDSDCQCGDGTIGICDSDGVCDLTVCGGEVGCIDDSECPIVSCDDGDFFGFCESDGFCDTDPADVCLPVSGCLDDSECPFVDCGDGTGDFGQCLSDGTCDVNVDDICGVVAGCLDDSDCDCGDGTLGVCLSDGSCDTSTCGGFGCADDTDCPCGDGTDGTCLSDGSCDLGSCGSFDTCACACTDILSMGGCANVCDADLNGNPDSPNFCNGVPALSQCAQCLADSCGIDGSDPTVCQ